MKLGVTGVRDFGDLIRYLAETHHKGSYYAMTKHLKMTNNLIYFWRDRVVKTPTDANIEKLCKTYDLDFWDVMRLIHRRSSALVLALSVGIATALYAPPTVTGQTESHHSVKFRQARWRLHPYLQRSNVAGARRALFAVSVALGLYHVAAGARRRVRRVFLERARHLLASRRLVRRPHTPALARAGC